MEFKIVGIASCDHHFSHAPKVSNGPADTYGEHVFLELRSVPYGSDQFGPQILIRFFENPLENVIVEESASKIVIHLPLERFDRFYKMICEAIFDNRYTLILKTHGQQKLTLAIFSFVPFYA